MGFGCMFIVTLTLIATSVAAQPKPGCQSHCGNISIPYPFGTGNGCNISSHFFIRCDTSFDPPKAFIRKGNHEVLHISLDGYLRVTYNESISYDCSNSSGPSSYSLGIALRKFAISHTRTKFTAIGCDTIAYVNTSYSRLNYSTGCLAFCSDVADVINGSCSGIGCCQTATPKGLWGYRFNFGSSKKHSNVLSFNPCSYGFIVEDGAYTFSASDLSDTNFRMNKFPMILEWTIGDQNCRVAKMDPENYACKQNSACIDPANGPGYLCKCQDGFKGNPYLSYGCQGKDICNLHEW